MASSFDGKWHGLDAEALQWIVLTALLTLAYAAYAFDQRQNAKPKSATQTLRGPENASYLLGNLRAVREVKDDVLRRWLHKYGPTFAIRGFLSTKEIVLSDIAALSYIYNQPMMFSKPHTQISSIKTVAGEGVLAAEGMEHKRQRRVVNPAFSPVQTRQFGPVFMRTAQELRDIWKSEILASSSPYVEIEVLEWLSKATLNVIGEAGFGYTFNALRDSTNELAVAYHRVSSIFSVLNPLRILTTYFPILQNLPTAERRILVQSRETRRRIGLDLIAKKKIEAEDPDALGKDLLSILIRANLSESGTDKLDDETVLAEISTFMLAGHETVAAQTTWGLYALSKAPVVQSKLREELLACPSEDPSMEQLNALPYLDKVVKELLRLHPAVPTSRRVPLQDVILPLASPVFNKERKKVHEIFLQAGDGILIHSYAVNTRMDLWGPDAFEFKPDRYDKLPEAVLQIPSVFGYTASFNAGPRACIGWNMAVLEIKALLFTLVKAFDFDIDPEVTIGKKLMITLRPFLVGQEENGVQLPLRISLHRTEVSEPIV